MTSVQAETIDGFDIPYRELSGKEADTEITWERFKAFHYSVGEDFLDQTGYGDMKIFAGWLMHKYQEHGLEILEICNSAICKEMLAFNELEMYNEECDDDIDLIYKDFAEFCNQTKLLKRKVNTILIIVAEYCA